MLVPVVLAGGRVSGRVDELADVIDDALRDRPNVRFPQAEEALDELAAVARDAEQPGCRCDKCRDCAAATGYEEALDRAETAEARVTELEAALREIQQDAVAGIGATNRLPYLTGIGVKAATALASVPPAGDSA